MPEIWRRLDEVGLQTTEACGDCPRVVLGSPLAGESLDEVIDGTPGDRRDRQALHRQAGVLQPAAQVQDRDLGPAGRRARGQRRRVHRRRPSRARPRLRPVGRRRPVHQPDAGPAGRRLGAAGRGARRVGGRRQRVPRLRLPPAAGQGAAEVPDQGLGRREVPRGSRDRVPEAAADRRPGARRRSTRPIDHVGVQRLKNGLNAVGVAPIAGRVSGTILSKVADLAEAAGSRTGSGSRRTRS